LFGPPFLDYFVQFYEISQPPAIYLLLFKEGTAGGYGAVFFMLHIQQSIGSGFLLITGQNQ